jgi:hypothetical protein
VKRQLHNIDLNDSFEQQENSEVLDEEQGNVDTDTYAFSGNESFIETHYVKLRNYRWKDIYLYNDFESEDSKKRKISETFVNSGYVSYLKSFFSEHQKFFKDEPDFDASVSDVLDNFRIDSVEMPSNESRRPVPRDKNLIVKKYGIEDFNCRVGVLLFELFKELNTINYETQYAEKPSMSESVCVYVATLVANHEFTLSDFESDEWFDKAKKHNYITT